MSRPKLLPVRSVLFLWYMGTSLNTIIPIIHLCHSPQVLLNLSSLPLKIRRHHTKGRDDKKSDERHLLTSDSVNIGDDEVVPGDVLELGHFSTSNPNDFKSLNNWLFATGNCFFTFGSSLGTNLTRSGRAAARSVLVVTLNAT